MKDDTAVNQTTTTLVDSGPVGLCLQQVCLLCGGIAQTISLCKDCIADLPGQRFACPSCALPMPDNVLCAHCLNSKRPPIIYTTALFNYRYPVNLIIQKIKFNADLVAAYSFGQLLANHLQTKGVDLPECIVPVPLHPLRFAQRGYNQALEIARPISRTLGLPLETTMCKRIRYTQSQTRLSVPQRKKNIQNSFTLNRRNRYKHIAIVDDVMTTGSTTRELARILCASGTDYIQVWVCTRASSQ